MALPSHISSAGTATPPGRQLIYALVGNPNCGKSTLFNALTGLKQKVGNYPGVTAEVLTDGGWYHTSDAGFIDAHGHLKIIDRVKDVGRIQGGANDGALMIGGGAALASVAGALLVPGSTEMPLILIMLGSSAASILAILVVIRRARAIGIPT